MAIRRNGSDVCLRRAGLSLAALTVAIALTAASCAGRTVATTTAADPAAVDLTQLWREPVDLESRDLFLGAGAGAPAPDAAVPFAFVAVDDSGYSPGYDVRDAGGTLWSVKTGPEAQTEVVASRILWAIGYHQVPTYYLATWRMTGGPEAQPAPGRFRPERPDRRIVGEWSWYENEFAHTQPFKGLVVANLMLNNWDWKTSNNKIYEVTSAGGPPARVYVVRDLGASLGKTSYPAILGWLPLRGLGQGSRNDLEGFESQAFIRGVSDGTVAFDYRGIHEELIDTLTVRDVRWTSELLSRVSDAQWQDAFRAAGYPPDRADRYIAKLKSKIAEGLALAGSAD
jgi:hypothetical protein